MRRFAWVALVAAAGCGEVTQLEAGPRDRFYFPTGMAVTAQGRLVVASSNFDLRYDEESGGSVIAVNPDPTIDPAPLLGATNVGSFGGQLALAERAACTAMRETGGDDLALLPVRGANVLYQLRVSPEGAISCADCAVPVGNTDHVDPYSVGVACGPGLARAYVGHLRSSSFSGWVTQVDLSRPLSDPGAVQHFSTGEGQVRGFAYDAEIERLYMTHTVAAGLPSRLRWVDLGGGCTVGEGLPAEGSCAEGFSVSGAVPNGLELRGIALASPAAPSGRVYLTARIHDPVASAASGVRVGDFDGMLLVADLLETLGGELDLAIVREIDLGYGAGEVVVLPRTDGRRDVVAALATDSGRLTIYDDDTGAVVAIGADLEGTDPTGAPLLGHVPVALAADPSVPGRLYVGSFQESFVTTIDVAVQATPATACLVAPGGGCAVGPDFAPRRISGGTP